MQFIQLKNISFTYPDHYTPTLRDITLDLADGEKIALIGRNGSGKSTLIRIIMRELLPSSGTITYPRAVPGIGYLAQDVMITNDCTVRDYLLHSQPLFHQLAAEIAELSGLEVYSEAQGLELAELWQKYYDTGAQDWEKAIDDMLIEIQLSHIADQSCKTLSGGESTRIQMAMLLINKPDILILDEPTNHLDTEQLEWLEQWISQYKGTVLYVSHDRIFIDNTATKVIELQNGNALIRSGNYQSFTRDKAELNDHQMVQYKERQRLVHRLQEASQKRRSWAKSFQPETQAEGGGFVYESVTNAARTMTQQAKHIEQRIKMLQTRYPVEKPRTEKPRKISFSQAPVSRKELISCQGLCFSYGAVPLLNDIYFFAFTGDRIWLSGCNGSGKTTLLSLLAGELQPGKGSISYGERLRIGIYHQDLTQLPAERTVIGYLKQSNKDEVTIRNFMGCMGLTGDIAFAEIGVLSWGERAKLQISRLLLEEYNILLLDEPTNHMDIPTREMLEKALSDYPGVLIFVSHDRAFIRNLATREYNLDK